MQQVKWNTRFNFRSAEPSEVVQFSVGVNRPAARIRSYASRRSIQLAVLSQNPDLKRVGIPRNEAQWRSHMPSAVQVAGSLYESTMGVVDGYYARAATDR